jgi:hypothetical protein
MTISRAAWKHLKSVHCSLDRAHYCRRFNPRCPTSLTLHEQLGDVITDLPPMLGIAQVFAVLQTQSLMQTCMRQHANGHRPDMLSNGRLGRLISAAPPLDQLVIHAGNPNRKSCP